MDITKVLISRMDRRSEKTVLHGMGMLQNGVLNHIAQIEIRKVVKRYNREKLFEYFGE